MTAKTKKKPKVDMKQIEKIIAGYERQRWALIPLVQEIQEKVGYIPPEVIPSIAKAVNLFPSQVQAVITFYSQLYTQPRGKNIVRVCRGTACHVRGAQKVLEAIQRKLGIKPGETTKDGKFTLETVSCLGACALGPVVVVGNDYHPTTVSTIDALFNKYEKTEEGEKEKKNHEKT